MATSMSNFSLLYEAHTRTTWAWLLEGNATQALQSARVASRLSRTAREFAGSALQGIAELVRAALESVSYQTRDLLDAMRKDWKGTERGTILRVDGGMVASDWTMQFLADILDAPVDRPTILETTALGAAWLAGSHAGVWPDMAGFAKRWALDRQFKPTMDAPLRKRKIKGWADAVRRTLSTT